MKFRHLLLLLCMFFSLISQAAEQDFYRLKLDSYNWTHGKRTSFLNGIVDPKVVEQLDSIYKKNPGTYEFIYSKETNSLKVFIHCSFDFYSVINGKLIKDYKYINRGYTCGPNLFYKDNAYHLLGGKGFWMNHVDLMKFDSLNGSWEFKQIKNQPLEYHPMGSYQSSKGITALFGEYYNPRIPRLEKEPFGYFLNWEKKTWQALNIETEGFDLSEIMQNNPSHLFETRDYGFIISNTQLPSLGWTLWVIIEKETGKLFLYEGNKSFEIINSSYKEIMGNTIRYFDYDDGSVTEGKEVFIDLDSIRSQSREIGQVVVLDAPEETDTNSLALLLPWIGLPVVFLLALWLGIQIQKRKNTAVQTAPDSDTEEDQESEEESEEILQQLLPRDGEKLNTEEFDMLLGIHQITNFDSKRIKRSRIIKAINKQYEEKKGFPLITRIKNPEDKRFVFYKITFENRSQIE